MHKNDPSDGLGINRLGTAILCFAWGETDRPEDICIARSASQVRHFMITEAINDEANPVLNEWMKELSEHDWRENGELLLEFKIGGVRLEDVFAPELPSRSAARLVAAEQMDWQQVILNGGAPCFHLCEDGRFCARPSQWFGHKNPQHHKFFSLADMVKLIGPKVELP